MCTAITYQNGNHYFGRNLDLEHTYCESVTVTPRRYPFRFRHTNEATFHFAMIGMAYVLDGYPLYYDATNEKGLSMAGLRFQMKAPYSSVTECSEQQVASFELLPWVLCQCETVDEARHLLRQTRIVNTPFNVKLSATPLHWIIADSKEAVTLELANGTIQLFDNPIGVLTNNPSFDFHMMNLNNYMSVSALPPENRFAECLDLKTYSLGMGGIGLPGDLSSASRFVRAAFTKLNAQAKKTEEASVTQFFHILSSVQQTRGCTVVRPDEYEITVYSSCCNTDKGIYYYTTYENNQITCVDMHAENLDSTELAFYPLRTIQQIYKEN